MLAPPLRVLHIVAPAPVGGLESVVRLLASGFRARGHDARVAAVISDQDSQPHPFVETLRADAIPVEILRAGARAYRAERAAVRALCQATRPHVVHTHGFRPDVVDGDIARRQGIPTVSTVHSFMARRWRGRLYEALQRQALRRFDAVVGVSQPICARLVGSKVPSRRVHFLPNAFGRTGSTLERQKARAHLGVPAAATVVGWVGRLSDEKGPDVMLDAFAKMADQRAVLLMIGHGPDDAALRERARDRAIADRIIWAGHVPGADRLLAALDVFVLSSRTEGTPMALLEAMAAGLPIVATRVGGVPAVLDATCARLTPSLDVEALASAVDAFLAFPEEARRFGEAARARLASQFAVDPWIAAYEQIYRQVAGGAAFNASN